MTRRSKAAAFVGGIVFGLGVLAGAALEHHRPQGTDAQRRNALDLAGHIAAMTAASCCHD